MNKKTSFILRLFIGIAILYFLLNNVGFQKIYQIIFKTNPYYLILAILVYILILIVGMINIKLLLLGKGYKNSIWKDYLLSWALGFTGLGKIGEFSLVYLMKKKGIPIGDGFAITVIDKIISIIVLAIILFFGIFIFFDKTNSIKLIICIFSIIIAIIIALLSNNSRKIIKKYILRRYSNKFKGFSKTLFYYLKKRRRILFLNIILTVIKWFLTSIFLFILFISIGIIINPIYILVICSITSLISNLPITISGLGVRETTAVFLYSKIGIETSIVAAVYSTALLIYYTIALIVISKK